MKRFELTIAQKGFAAGKAFFIEKRSGSKPAAADDAETEEARFDDAVRKLDKELTNAASKADKDNVGIYEMESLLLKDDKFIDTAKKLIADKKLDAAAAAIDAGKELAEVIRGNESEYIRQRGDDIIGLSERLADIIRSGQSTDALKEPAIIVADELSPAQLTAFDQEMILGIVTVNGAPTSHVSIMAGNLGIPYCYGSSEAVGAIRAEMSTNECTPDEKAEAEGRDVLLMIDGSMLATDLDKETYQKAVLKMNELNEKKKRELENAHRGSTRTKVYANISGPQEIDALKRSGAEGVGLFRTELLFLADKEAPSEEEQFQAYKAVAEAMAGKETVIRTMDLGSDKKADWLKLPDEKNPALGCRGVRVSLKEEALFRTQLRALLRAAVYGNVRIMVPMIAACREVEAVRTLMEKCAKELADEDVEYRVPPLGIMVETPAAVMIADELSKIVDFFSIGTNDLTQYTLALDREAVGLDEYYDPMHDAVLRLIEMTASAGHQNNVPTAVCGELAANPEAVEELIRRGVDELSVSVGKVEKTKALVIDAEKRLAGNEENIELAAAADGRLIPMEDIPDPAFAGGTLGRCVGIMPDNGKIYAPCDGTVSGIAETRHAITFTASNGMKILVHVGIDTVNLGGNGFSVLVKEGDPVHKGDQVMEADLDVIKNAGFSPMVIILLLS
ncbi:MAG: phosphoenolpyruvate--protein phosphotransferase [Eubacterium sp.]|nr:phosphoenolpyruvate--protein phosphotransferase [Eubacterium sp.]